MTPPRSRTLLALLTALVIALVAGCQSTAGGDGSSGSSGSSTSGGSSSGGSGTSGGAAAVADPPSKDADSPRVCGKPPCMRFVSRSETKSLEDTFTNHPIASAIAVHLVGTLLCGGILCLLGEGAGLTYIEHETKTAARANECLKVNILPSGAEWKIVAITPSDQSPYCKD